MTFLKQIDGRWQGRGNASPRTLFQSAEPGFYLDFSTTQPLYQDTLAATPLTLPDQSVGLAADRSRTRSPITVAAAVQASLGLRPKWGRMPKGGRRNMATYTSQFANAAWLKFDASYASGKFTEGTGATIHRLNQADTIVAGQNYVFWAEVQAAERTRVLLRTNNGSVDADTVFDLSNGTIVSGTGGVAALGGGWYRVWRTFTAAASTTSNFIKQMLLVNTGSNTSYTGDGTSGVLLRFAQFEVGTTPTAGQEVTNVFDVTEAGVPSYGYIRPDLMDDFLTVTTPAAQTGDVMVFGRKGSWLETGVAYGSGAAVSIGPTTMTGLPAGLLQAVQGPVSDISGGLVGVLAIGRALTDAERTAALNYYKARGAAGLLAAGANAAVNGGFDTDTVWTKGTGWTISGGAANCNGSQGATSYLYQSCLTVGVTYEVTLTATNVSGTGRISLGNTSPNIDLANGTNRFIQTCAGNTNLLLVALVGVAFSVDNISVKRLTVTP